MRQVDKSRWPDGPWMYEPDQENWTDAETGLSCVILRHPDLGHLCGYVGVPKDHPAHGKDYDDDLLSEAHEVVHWGLTYSAPSLPEDGIEDRWLFGFDCAHSCDLSPGNSLFDHIGETYRDMHFVREHCRRLAGALWYIAFRGGRNDH